MVVVAYIRDYNLFLYRELLTVTFESYLLGMNLVFVDLPYISEEALKLCTYIRTVNAGRCPWRSSLTGHVPAVTTHPVMVQFANGS